MTVLVLLICILLGAGGLAWGYTGVGLAWLGRWILAAGAVWAIAVWQRWRWFAHVGLGIYFAAAALGLWFLSFPPGWMFAGAVCGLLAWDLTFFRHRQLFAASDAERRRVELRHLLQVSALAILGFLIASLAMLLRLEFSFDWLAFLVLVITLALSQVFRWFRSRA